MGGGIAGLVFAARAAELGSTVVVLEQGQDELYRCNTRFTGGAFHLCFHDVNEPPQALAEAIRTTTDGFADDALTEAISLNARNAVGWLRTCGIRMMKAGPDAWRQNFLAPPSLLQPGLNWQGRGGDMLLRQLRQMLEARGGRLLRGAKVVRLLIDQGCCIGVEYKREGKIASVAADAVMLADGGFQANLEMLRNYVSPAPERLKQRGAGVSGGDAIRLAAEAGAALSGMENIYGHLLCQDAVEDDRLWPYPIMDSVAAASIIVDRSGRRILDEGLGGVYMTNALARLPDPQGTIVVFDSAIWGGPATEFVLPANPYLALAGGTIEAAGSIRDLAIKTGVEPDGLGQTVASYNAALAENGAVSLIPSRTGDKARPILQPPFHAVKLVPGITFTMGGIRIDSAGRVLRGSGDAIPGLYASGCCTGGLEGGVHAGYVGGLAKSATISWLAAAHAVRYE